MSDSKFQEIGRILREHRRFAILGHVRPDGDALGSQLALALSLQALGKEVRVWNEDGMLEKYSFLPGPTYSPNRPPLRRISMLPSRSTRQFKAGLALLCQQFGRRKSGLTSITT